MFDLDDTLYNEKDYLFQGYTYISEYLGLKYSINANVIYQFLTNNFNPSYRSHLFDIMLDNFKISRHELQFILNILRTFEPKEKIRLFPELKELLNCLKSNKILFVVVTNGNQTQQQNKIKFIDWGDLKPMIYYASDYESKPSPKVYYESIFPSHSNILQSGKIVFIGDSEVDKIFAENIGVPFINVNEILNNK